MKEVKACPFCGSNRFSIALINVEHTNHNGRIGTYIVRDAPPAVQIRCKDCGASMANSFGVKDEVYRRIDIINEVTDSLIDKWNERHIDLQTQLKAERLNRLSEWENELENKADDLMELGTKLDEKETELKYKEEKIEKEAEFNIEKLKSWNNQLDFREKYLARRDLEIGEKLQRYLEIRDELLKFINQIGGQNEIINQINDMLKNTDDEDGDAPLALLNLTLSTIRNNKNNN